MGTCFFIGHHDAPASLQEKLKETVVQSITAGGISQFIVGNYGRFDAMAAEAVKAAKKKHPEVRLSLLLPYHPAERPIAVPDGFDDTYYPFEERVPQRLAIVKANRKLIDSCDLLIAYAVHPGNARNLLEYAERPARKGKLKVVNLGE